MKITIILLGLLVALFVSQTSAGACTLCAATISPVITTTASAGALQYVPAWGVLGGASQKACYWCDASRYVANIGIGTCYPIFAYAIGSCTNLKCTLGNSTNYLVANPNATASNCSLVPSVYISWPWRDIGDVKCGCTNGQGNREDGQVDRKYSLTVDEIRVLEEKNKLEGRQTTPDCTHSLICDPASRTDCPSGSTCLDNSTIPCSNIAGTNQTCPGYLNSYWGNSSCPLGAGSKCSICSGASCIGTYSQHVCQGAYPCLLCHNINLYNGTTVCAAHVAPSASTCFCAPPSGPPSGKMMGYCPSRDESPQGQAMHSRLLPHGQIIPGMCAPWGEDIITMRCYAGRSADGTWRVATTTDCATGMAVPPTVCPGTYQCGGHLCGAFS